jgi:hypothetical protein
MEPFSKRCSTGNRQPACSLPFSLAAHKTDPMLARLLAVSVIATCALVARADLYSCVAPDGRSALHAKRCPSANHVATKRLSRSSAPNASTDSNLPAVAKHKWIEVGYLPLDESEFDKCRQDILQTAYKAICEQAGRVGERLDPCLRSLRTQDQFHAKAAPLDYHCLARDKPFGSPQYRVCTVGIK